MPLPGLATPPEPCVRSTGDAGRSVAITEKSQKRCASAEPCGTRRPWSRIRADIRGIPHLSPTRQGMTRGDRDNHHAEHALMAPATLAPTPHTEACTTGRHRPVPRAHQRRRRYRALDAYGPGLGNRRRRTPPGPASASPAQAPPPCDTSLAAPGRGTAACRLRLPGAGKVGCAASRQARADARRGARRCERADTGQHERSFAEAVRGTRP